MDLKETVKKVSKLVKIKLNEKEEKEMVKHFEKMLLLIEKIKQIKEIEKLKPLFNPNENLQFLILRKDKKEIFSKIIDGYIEAPSPLKGIMKKKEKQKNA